MAGAFGSLNLGGKNKKPLAQCKSISAKSKYHRKGFKKSDKNKIVFKAF
jgi:hypothetical protein